MKELVQDCAGGFAKDISFFNYFPFLGLSRPESMSYRLRLCKVSYRLRLCKVDGWVLGFRRQMVKMVNQESQKWTNQSHSIFISVTETCINI